MQFQNINKRIIQDLCKILTKQPFFYTQNITFKQVGNDLIHKLYKKVYQILEIDVLKTILLPCVDVKTEATAENMKLHLKKYTMQQVLGIFKITT